MIKSNGKISATLLALLCLGGLTAALVAQEKKPVPKDPPPTPPTKEPAQEPAKEPAKEPVKEAVKEPNFLTDPALGWLVPRHNAHMDRFGDDLPADAIARLGTVRWRQGSPITLLTFLPDNKTVLTAGADQSIRIWEASTGKLIRTFNASGSTTPFDTGGVPEWAYNPGQSWTVVSADGKLVSTCSQRDMKVRIFEVETGKMTKEIGGLQYGVTSMSISNDNKYVSYVGYDGSVNLIDIAAGKVDKTWNKPDGQNRVFYGGINGGGFSPDNKQLVTIANDMENQGVVQTLKVWDVANGKVLHSLRNPQNAYGFYSPTYSPDGKVLAWGSGDGNIRIHDAATGKEIKTFIPGSQNRGGMMQLTFAADSKKLYTKSYGEQGFREFDVSTGKELRQLGDVAFKPQRNVVYYSNYAGGTMSVSKDGKHLIGVGGNSAVYMVDLTTGKEVPTTTAGHDSVVLGVQYVDAGKTLVTQGMDGTLRRWEVASGKELGQVKLPSQQNAPNAYVHLLSPDGKLMASASYDGTVQMSDAESGKQTHKITIDQQRRGYMVKMAFSPNNKLLAVRSQMDPQVYLFSTETGKELQKLTPLAADNGNPNYYYGNQWQFLTFSDDSKFVAAAGVNQDNSIRVWETANGNEQRQFTFTQGKFVTNGTFSPDGRTVALECNDSTVSIFELNTGKQRRQFGDAPQNKQQPQNYGFYGYYGVQSTASTVSYSPNGQLLAIAGKDRKVRLWEVATGKELGIFEGHQGSVMALAFGPDSKTLTTCSSDTTALVWDVTKRDKNRTARTGELKGEDLAAKVKLLDSTDSKQAAEAFAALWAAPKSTVPFLAENVKPAVSTEESLISQLITDLDSNRFTVRKKALDELEKMGEVASPQLQKALTGAPSVEVKKRVTELLDRVAMKALTAEQLRGLRVIELLEQINTPESKEVLTKLAKGAPAAFLTTEAQAALERMSK